MLKYTLYSQFETIKISKTKHTYQLLPCFGYLLMMPFFDTLDIFETLFWFGYLVTTCSKSTSTIKSFVPNELALVFYQKLKL